MLVVPEAQASPAVTPAERSTVARRGGALVLAAAVVVAGAVATGDPVATGGPTLLGRIDDHSGMSSTIAPPAELGQLWRRPVEEPAGLVPQPTLRRRGDRVRIGRDVVDVARDEVVGTGLGPAAGAGSARTGTGSLDLAVAGDRLVTFEPTTGAVRGRVTIEGVDGAGWRPGGQPLGSVAGATIVPGVDGRLAAVAADGRIAWVLPPDVSWDGVGHGTRWLVGTAAAAGRTARVVVDGRTGVVARELGPAGLVVSPAVLGDTVAWLDHGRNGEPSLAQQVRVAAVDLATGEGWRTADLPATTGAQAHVRLEVAADAFAVSYASAGDATTAVWLAGDGTRRSTIAARGNGATADGWPRARVAGDALLHVDGDRDEVRAVTTSGTVRWAVPGAVRVGLVVGDGVVLLRTAPAGLSGRARLRLVDLGTGEVLWQGVRAGWQRLDVVAALEGVVGLADECCAAGAEQWFDGEHGRRRDAATLVQRWGGAAGDVLQGTVAGAVAAQPVVGPPVPTVRAADRTWTLEDGVLHADGAELDTRAEDLVAATPDGPLAVVDGDLVALDRAGSSRWVAAPVAAGSVVRSDGDAVLVVDHDRVTLRHNDGDVLWQRDADVLLQPGTAVLHHDLVLVADVAGRVLAFDRARGVERLRADDVVASAVTAAGDLAVVGGADGWLALLDLDAGGAPVQRVRLGSDPVEDVAVVDRSVVVTVGEDLAVYGRGAAFVELDDRVEVP